jgi:predicted NBD/HSP70 family sugar kinase
MMIRPPLDPQFQPASLANREHRRHARQPLLIALEGEPGRVSRYETVLNPAAADAARYVERLVKFLLWSRGGWKLYIAGAPATVRAFDADLMTRVYERPFEVVVTTPDQIPAARESGAILGGHLDGCRIGFDLGASDFKIAAVNNGEVVFADEFPWDPRNQPDPQYHFDHLQHGLTMAAAKLPRVDAIGGSTAGVVVDNRIMVASLFRSVPAAKFPAARDIFLRLRDHWRVPLEVANDGDVTALAGGMSLKVAGVLGVAMGSSEAAGFLSPTGQMTGWLSELAFAPVDYNPNAPVDEWSGDCGVGASYFSQQAVGRLLAPAGIELPAELGLPEKLKAVQALMAQGDPRAAKIYETIGVYLGYTIPHYAEFYDFRHLLVLGRVTTGQGGDLLLAKAREVLEAVFPEVASRIQLHLPDEKSKRVGQAVAAASLPKLK